MAASRKVTVLNLLASTVLPSALMGAQRPMPAQPEPFPSLGPNVNLAMSSLGANSSIPRGRTDTNWQLFGNILGSCNSTSLRYRTHVPRCSA